jgi:hypothetical protein
VFTGGSGAARRPGEKQNVQGGKSNDAGANSEDRDINQTSAVCNNELLNPKVT